MDFVCISKKKKKFLSQPPPKLPAPIRKWTGRQTACQLLHQPLWIQSPKVLMEDKGRVRKQRTWLYGWHVKHLVLTLLQAQWPSYWEDVSPHLCTELVLRICTFDIDTAISRRPQQWSHLLITQHSCDAGGLSSVLARAPTLEFSASPGYFVLTRQQSQTSSFTYRLHLLEASRAVITNLCCRRIQSILPQF